MKVIIRQREDEYKSDYPDGWKFSAGDPFKFPVIVSTYPCFIKRFEQKSPEDISGWDLLVKMTGKEQKNLSRVYDIRNEQEDGKEIYYVFYEYLDGSTLDKYLREPNVDINLIHLNNDLFSAIRALQDYEFWFADFTEKNIFCQKDGSFVLVDVDSTQRITDLPINDMYGSKDYWILVLKFCKEILNKNDIRLADINGINLNYLQIAFLILRLKLFLSGNRDDYNSTNLFNQLPSRLDKMVPEFRDIYLNIIESGKDPLSQADISKIEDIIERKIIKTADIPEVTIAPVSLPVIKEFTTSKSEIESGGAFTLSWQVENANKLELYKNGAKFKDLDTGQTEVTLKEFADGTRQQSSYYLIAYQELNMAKSEPATIKLKSDIADEPASDPVTDRGSGKKTRWPIFAGSGLLAVIIIIVLLLNNHPGKKIDENGSVTANAGPDITIKLPENTVSLEGKGTDSTGNPIKATYAWKNISAPKVDIINADRPTASVRGLTEGTYLFEFKVSNDNGATAKDTVQVTVSPAASRPPIADAGPNKRIILPGLNSITLEGRGTAPDAGGSITAYSWTKVAGPAKGIISTPANAPTITVTGMELGTYQFQLAVTDNKGATGIGTVLVYVVSKLIYLPGDWKVAKTIEINPGVKLKSIASPVNK